MTSRERLLAAARLERVDRVPVSPFGLGHLSPRGALAEELIRETDPFLTAGIGSPFFGRALKTETFSEGDRTTTIFHTPKGDLRQVRQRTEITSATIEFPLRTADDIEKLLSVPYVPAEPDPTGFLEWKQRIGEEALVLAGIGTAVCFPANLFSPEDFCLLWADAPEAMQDLVRVAADRLNAFIDKACTLGVTEFRLVGGEYVTTQLGPAAVPSLLSEPDAEVMSIIHRHGGIVYYHNHGPMMRYLPALAALDIDFLDPLEGPPYADTDLREARRILGDRICMVGNLDDMEVIESCSESEIRRLGAERLEAAGTRGFCLGGTASGTYGERAARNFMALVEVAEEFGG